MPTLLEVMQSRLGIQELPGRGHNPVIVGWFKSIGHPEVQDDETSWCSVCCGSAAIEAGWPIPPVNVNMLARSWLTWGREVAIDDIQPGDVAVWPRGNSSWQGHVNVVESVKGKKVVCIGGNQGGLAGGDAVTRAKPRSVSEALGFRRPVAATVPALREAGSTEIKQADRIQNSGTAVTFVPMMWAAVQTAWNQMFGPVDVPKFASLPESLSWWQALLEGAKALLGLVAEHPWLAGTLVMGLLCVLVGRQLKANRVAKHAQGVPLSVEVAKLVEAA